MTPTPTQTLNRDIIAFCRCPTPTGQRRRHPNQAYRMNVLIDASDIGNPAHRCLSCGSTYSIAAPLA